MATSATQALPASVTQALLPPSAVQTPPPVLKTPVPIVLRSSGSYRRTPTPAVARPAGGATARTLVIGGLCMIAFSCGVMCTIAVDRLWPRAHTQCVGAPPAGPGAAPAEGPGAASAPDIEAAAEPTAPATTMAVTPLPPPEPSLPALSPLPTPAAGDAVAPARKIVPAASTAVAAARPIRGAAVARVQPAQGRAVVRKRPASASSLPVDTMSPSGMWVDPFAQ